MGGDWSTGLSAEGREGGLEGMRIVPEGLTRRPLLRQAPQPVESPNT